MEMQGSRSPSLRSASQPQGRSGVVIFRKVQTCWPWAGSRSAGRDICIDKEMCKCEGPPSGEQEVGEGYKPQNLSSRRATGTHLGGRTSPHSPERPHHSHHPLLSSGVSPKGTRH